MDLVRDVLTAVSGLRAPACLINGWAFLKRHVVPVLIGFGALGLMSALMLHGLRDAKAARVEARVTGNVASAVQAGASDAVNTVTHEVTRERDIERTVINAQASVQVAGDGAAADAAGRGGLCGLSASFCATSGVQRSDTGGLGQRGS